MKRAGDTNSSFIYSTIVYSGRSQIINKIKQLAVEVITILLSISFFSVFSTSTRHYPRDDDHHHRRHSHDQIQFVSFYCYPVWIIHLSSESEREREYTRERETGTQSYFLFLLFRQTCDSDRRSRERETALSPQNFIFCIKTHLSRVSLVSYPRC